MQHTITLNNIHSFCRTCLNELPQPPTHNIQEMDVQIRLWLQESMDDIHPIFVCELCRGKLECFLEFHQMSTRSRKILQDILEKRGHNLQEKTSIASWEPSEMAVVAEAAQDDTRNVIQVNCDWLEFDFVAIPKSLIELQSKTYKQELSEKEELLTPAICPTSAKRNDSVDSSEHTLDNEFSHPHDKHLTAIVQHTEKNATKISKTKTPESSSKIKWQPETKEKSYGEEKPQHVCEECGKVYPSLARLTEHQYSHKPIEEYPFHCTECSKAFKHRQTFNAHQLRHAGIKNYQCPYCDVKKTTKSELRTHMNSHTKERQWLCPKCPQICSSAANLRRHDQVVHQGIRRFACRHCDQTFGKQESLKHHEMRHTGEKPHACSECGKRFIQLVSMKTHMKTHNKHLS